MSAASSSTSQSRRAFGYRRWSVAATGRACTTSPRALGLTTRIRPAPSSRRRGDPIPLLHPRQEPLHGRPKVVGNVFRGRQRPSLDLFPLLLPMAGPHHDRPHSRKRLGERGVGHVIAIDFFFNETATTEIYTFSLHDPPP